MRLPAPVLNLRPRTFVTATLLTAATLAGGCASGNPRGQWNDSAEARWSAMRSTALVEMAQGQFDGGQLDLAEATIRDAAAIAPDDPRVHLLAGRIALENGLLERAYHHFGDCLEKATPAADPSADDDAPAPEPAGPHAADAYYFRAVVLQRWQRGGEALADYRAAAELDPERPRRVLAVAETLVALDRVDEAARLLEDKKTYFDQNAAVRALLAHIQTLRGEHALAVDNFREATLLDPENLRIKEELAFAQLKVERFADAAETLRELTARDVNAGRDDLTRALARAEAANGRHREARDVLSRLTRRNPGSARDWLSLGDVCWKMDDLGGALIAANRAVALEPRRAEGYLLAGLVWQKRARHHEALQMFDAAADVAPNNPTPVILRGITLQQSDRVAAAAEAYREALRIAPEDPRPGRLLAKLERGAGVDTTAVGG